MGEAKRYWPFYETFGELHGAIDLEARAGLALHLIQSYGSVAGKAGAEDSSGRSRLELQTPAELVERCFQIADLFIAEAERRGEIKSMHVIAAEREKKRNMAKASR